jgi:hypothetical protein
MNVIYSFKFNTPRCTDYNFILCNSLSNYKARIRVNYYFASQSVKQILKHVNMPDSSLLFQNIISLIGIPMVFLGCTFFNQRVFFLKAESHHRPLAALSIGISGEIGNLAIINPSRFYRLIILATNDIKKALFKASMHVRDQRLFAVVKIDSPLSKCLHYLGFSKSSDNDIKHLLCKMRPLLFCPIRLIIWHFMSIKYQAWHLSRGTLTSCTDK